jgi:thiamine biosynthesis protein ThiS
VNLTVNGKLREQREGCTITVLLEELGIPASTTVAELNSRIVPRSDYATLELHEGDAIELVTIVGGG